MKVKMLVAGLLPVALGLAACGGSSSGSGLTPVVSNETPPNFISYPDPNLFVEDVPITPLVPQITGGRPTNYLVQPDLPVGLRIDAEGRIVGTPTQNTAPATYLVTAGNSAGTTSFGVRITVVGRYTVGGTVAGLAGGTLVLTVNGVDPLSITADGAYLFPGRYVPGDNYDVAVSTQPAGQTCTVTGATGVIANSDYHGAFVSCAASSNKLADASPALPFGELVAALDESLGDPRSVVCFFASHDKNDRIAMTLGFRTFELEPLPGAETPSGCGMHLVTLDAGEKRVYVGSLVTNSMSVFVIR